MRCKNNFLLPEITFSSHVSLRCTVWSSPRLGAWKPPNRDQRKKRPRRLQPTTHEVGSRHQSETLNFAGPSNDEGREVLLRGELPQPPIRLPIGLTMTPFEVYSDTFGDVLQKTAPFSKAHPMKFESDNFHTRTIQTWIQKLFSVSTMPKKTVYRLGKQPISNEMMAKHTHFRISFLKDHHNSLPGEVPPCWVSHWHSWDVCCLSLMDWTSCFPEQFLSFLWRAGERCSASQSEHRKWTGRRRQVTWPCVCTCLRAERAENREDCKQAKENEMSARLHVWRVHLPHT